MCLQEIFSLISPSSFRLGEILLCSYGKNSAEMVCATISAAFVVNATTAVSIKSSNFAA